MKELIIAEIFKEFQLLSTFANNSILDVCHGSKYTSG